MKTLITALSFMFLSLVVFAQENRRGYIGIALGPSIPFGDYGSADQDNHGAAFATNGSQFNMNFGYKFSKRIGLAGLWNGNSHALNQDKLEEMVAKAYPDLDWDVVSHGWSSMAIMGGPLISFPYNRMDLDMKALFGYASSTSPFITITAIDGRTTLETNQFSASAVSPAFNLGVGLRFKASEKTGLSINMDYYSTRPEFTIKTYSSFGPSSTDTGEVHMHMLNISFGIGYRLK
jgi:hypothetical protein